MMEQVTMGTLDMTCCDTADWAAALNIPELAVFNMPFLTKDLATQAELIRTIIPEEVPKMLEGSGTRLLMTYSNGIRQPLLKNKPITCLEDIKAVSYTHLPQDVLPSITYWLMGSMASTTRTTLIMGAPFILAGSLLLFLLRWKLNTMSLPEDEAKSLGIPVKRIRSLVILGAAMVTAAVVSMCGQIGWIGLLIPHMVRMIFGNDNRSVVPASMASGALFMLIIDTAARSVMALSLIHILISGNMRPWPHQSSIW